MVRLPHETDAHILLHGGHTSDLCGPNPWKPISFFLIFPELLPRQQNPIVTLQLHLSFSPSSGSTNARTRPRHSFQTRFRHRVRPVHDSLTSLPRPAMRHKAGNCHHDCHHKRLDCHFVIQKTSASGTCLTTQPMKWLVYTNMTARQRQASPSQQLSQQCYTASAACAGWYC
jgi:hypothetical protein